MDLPTLSFLIGSFWTPYPKSLQLARSKDNPTSKCQIANLRAIYTHTYSTDGSHDVEQGWTCLYYKNANFIVLNELGTLNIVKDNSSGILLKVISLQKLHHIIDFKV